MIARLIHKVGIVTEHPLPEFIDVVSISYTISPLWAGKLEALLSPNLPTDKKMEFKFESWVEKDKEAYYREI